MRDMYKHLNENKDFKIELDIEQVAKMVCNCNYGLHRFISAVIGIYEESEYKKDKKLAEELTKLLERGLY